MHQRQRAQVVPSEMGFFDKILSLVTDALKSSPGNLSSLQLYLLDLHFFL